MTAYPKMTAEERKAEYAEVTREYEELKARGLNLNMARGKPGKAQLDLVSDIFSLMQKTEDYVSDGVDVRNYGELSGLPAAKRLFAEILGCRPEQVFVGGNASLQLMYDTISKAYTHGLLHSERPWCREPVVKFLCPAPGYDRHFAVTDYFGFELLTVDMTETGPDMDQVESFVRDPLVKGIWCVPLYSNPDGITYSDETVRRMAALRPAAPDFRIMWDNAYCVHHLTDTPDVLLNLYDEAKAVGNEDIAVFFASTSKISFPGSGIAGIAASPRNLADIRRRLSIQTIGSDKLNMLRHARYFGDIDGIRAHMKLHAAILRPKFAVVLDTLSRELGGTGIAAWHEPRGGYFVSVNLLPGCAKETVRLLAEAGVVMTGAGATYPYGRDPKDSNIRIAPTFPSVEELQTAMELFCVCAKLAAARQLLGDRPRRA